MGKLGWSYPAGCQGPPDDDGTVCMECFRGPGSCVCPECPVCGQTGNPVCYAFHGLKHAVRPGQLMAGEAEAVAEVKRLGSIYGYGNLIDHLRRAWKELLIAKGLDATTATHHVGLSEPEKDAAIDEAFKHLD